MAHLRHRAEAPASVNCFVLTISDTRTEANDASGDAIVEVLQQAGHRVSGRAIVRDDPAQVRAAIGGQLHQGDTQAVITTGGTGISARDSTYEAIDAMLEKRLPGFGELFRMLSYQEIGSAAMLSRACAGTIQARIVIALPGSTNAVKLAMTKLVAPELGHCVGQLRQAAPVGVRRAQQARRASAPKARKARAGAAPRATKRKARGGWGPTRN